MWENVKSSVKDFYDFGKQIPCKWRTGIILILVVGGGGLYLGGLIFYETFARTQ
jgi:hypothetical protein